MLELRLIGARGAGPALGRHLEGISLIQHAAGSCCAPISALPSTVDCVDCRRGEVSNWVFIVQTGREGNLKSGARCKGAECASAHGVTGLFK